MKTPSIFFFKEGIKFRLLHGNDLKLWLTKIVTKENRIISNINYIFCTDIYLRRINKKFLSHDYFTDIVTFDNSTSKKFLEGDIYISIDRILANSKTYNTSFKDELHRVMAHGVLHLLGYDDTNKKKKEEMRRMEDYWLGKRNFQ
jgi:probable rRNA maturation factor